MTASDQNGQQPVGHLVLIPDAITVLMHENACGAAEAAKTLRDQASKNRLSIAEVAATIVTIAAANDLT